MGCGRVQNRAALYNVQLGLTDKGLSLSVYLFVQSRMDRTNRDVPALLSKHSCQQDADEASYQHHRQPGEEGGRFQIQTHNGKSFFLVHLQKNYFSCRERVETMCYLLHWYPKFYDNVFSFVGFTTLGTLVNFDWMFH